MSGYTTIEYEIDGATAHVRLNRPEKFNAIDRVMAGELLEAFRRVRDEPDIAVVILSGAGGSFCVGGDLSIFPSLAEHTASLDWLAHDGYEIGKAIELCEKVVVAKVHGHCVAGGLELALMCDLVYAHEDARFGATEINMGLLPGWGGTVRIARAMPVHRAREIIYSGRKDYTAAEMYEMGFLTRVFPAKTFDDEIGSTIANLASKKPIALRMAKEVITRSLETPSLDAALALERNAIQWLNHAPDIQAAMARFRDDPNGLVASQKQTNRNSDRKA